MNYRPPTEAECEAYRQRVANVQAQYDLVAGRLIRMLVERDSLGGQIVVDRLTPTEANARLMALAEGPNFWRVWGAPTMKATKLEDFLGSHGEYQDRYGKHFIHVDGMLTYHVQLWAPDHSVKRAWKSHPPIVDIVYKSRRRRKWERANLKPSKNLCKMDRQTPSRCESGEFHEIIRGNFRTKPEIEYFSGISEY